MVNLQIIDVSTYSKIMAIPYSIYNYSLLNLKFIFAYFHYLIRTYLLKVSKL